MYDYNSLLDKAMAQVPEKLKKDTRFEVPELKSRIEGNKTIILNFTEAINKIERDTKQVLKYLAKELGTQGMIEGNTAIFTGKFGFKLINQKFDKYIKEYVYCPQCGKPDTKLIKEGRILFIKCEACGARSTIK